jgi:hypothetical protein
MVDYLAIQRQPIGGSKKCGDHTGYLPSRTKVGALPFYELGYFDT